MKTKQLTKQSQQKNIGSFLHMVALSFIICLLPLHHAKAQIGSWRSYQAYSDIQEIQAAGDYIFVMASNGLYQYNQTDQSITTYDKINGLSDTEISHIRWNQQAKRLVVTYSNSNIDLVETNGRVTNVSDIYSRAITGDKAINSIYTDGQYAYLACGFGIVKLNVKNAEISESYMLGFPVTAVAIQNNAIYAQGYGGYGTWTAALTDNLIDKSNWRQTTTNLPSFAPDNTDYNQYLPLVSTLNPGGPKYNYFGFMRFKHNRLYTCGGGYTASAEMNLPAVIQILNNDHWTCLPDTINKITGWDYKDMLSVDADPHDPEHIFAGGRTGLYEFQGENFVKAYNLNNSPLQSATTSSRYVLVEGLLYDEKNTLWLLNSQNKALKSIFEYNVTTQEWTDHHKRLLEVDGKSLGAMKSPYKDSRGYIWFVNSHWIVPSVYCYDPATDEIINYFKTLVNQDGMTYAEYDPYGVVEDMNGDIWIYTNKGPFVVEKDNITQQGTNVTQIKVPRNDGTNYADYLLSDVVTYCMALDGGGRKWFGTLNNGVFLISADNMTQEAHFTTENSSLLSNNIYSIAINQETGEVFFGTDKGLCSYMSDASVSNTDMKKDNVWAYPNPVTPDYTGLITIKGLSFNADIKILNASGKLIRQGRSNGGSFTWDGCDETGRKVSSGIYMVATATSEGKKGTVCKIAIVR